MKNNKILRKSLAGYGIFLISSVVALLIVGNVLAGTYSNLISTIFQQSTTKKIEIDNKDEINTDYFTSNYSSQTELYNAEVDFATKIQAEGSVLLQNKGLPIAEKGNITLLGSSISKKAFLVSGGGSGSIDTAQTPTLKEVFENEGYKINSAMWDFYNTGAAANKVVKQPKNLLLKGVPQMDKIKNGAEEIYLAPETETLEDKGDEDKGGRFSCLLSKPIFTSCHQWSVGES